MSGLACSVRFFRVVSPVHPLMAAAFGAALGMAGAILMVDVTRAAGALAPLFLLQTLATSSGFAGPARRGHYDLLLTTGRSRLQIGLVHWAMSASPGIASWLTVGVIEVVLRAGFAPISLSSGTLAGMFLVSTVPWAATVRLPRLTGGIAWVVLLVVAMTVMPSAYRDTFVETETHHGFVATAVAVLLCPWILVGRPLTGNDMMPVVTAGLLASAAMVAALWWIDRADLPLEAAQ